MLLNAPPLYQQPLKVSHLGSDHGARICTGRRPCAGVGAEVVGFKSLPSGQQTANDKSVGERGSYSHFPPRHSHTCLAGLNQMPDDMNDDGKD